MLKTSSHYVVILLELAQKLGMNIDALRSDVGLITLQPAAKDPLLSNEKLGNESLGNERLCYEKLDNQWLDNKGLANLIKAMWRHSGDETLGIDPQSCRMGTWALACDYMVAAETLGELYRRGEKIYSFVPPESMGINFSVDDTKATVEVLGYIGNRDPHHFLMEFLTIVWHRFACWAIDETIPLNQAFFTYPAPDHYRFYQELFQCPVAFDQPVCGYSFSKKYLNSAVCRNREELAAWLRDSPADLLYIPGRDSSITHYIRKQLARELREQMRYPAFDDVCNGLHMSTQVVRRRLEEEGASYQKIKDAVRLELVKELLLNPDLSILDIAERSGFTEAASLTRAFKKWTGITPVQYRNKKLKKH